MSEQVADLEHELDIPLIDRQHRQIHLTLLREHFLEDARAIIGLADKAVAKARKAQRGEAGTLTIGFFVGGIGTFVPSTIREFRRRFEDVQVLLVEQAPAMQLRALLARTIDVAFTRPVPVAQSALLRSEHFQTEPRYAVLPSTHPLAKRRSIAVRELADECFVLNDRRHSPVVFNKVMTLFAQAEMSPRMGASATVSSGVIALVEAGEGVAVLPQGSKSLGGDALVFVPLSDSDASVDLVLAWSVEHANPVVKSFLELARKRRKKTHRKSADELC